MGRNAGLPELIRFHKFPVAGIDAMTASTSRSYPRHTHDQYGIGVIDSGGHASSSDRRQVEAGPGSLIFVNPGEVHDGRAIGGRARSWRMLYFEPLMIETARAEILERANAPLTFAAPVFADETLRRLFNIAFTQATASAVCRGPMAGETAILRLAARFEVNSTTGARTSGGSTAPIRRARDRINADPAARLTLVDLAREVGVSRYQLIRGFGRELGLTPHAYILQQRLALARRLIRGGQAVAEAAAVAGFFDQSHLTRCFVRQFGVGPSRYASNTG